MKKKYLVFITVLSVSQALLAFISLELLNNAPLAEEAKDLRAYIQKTKGENELSSAEQISIEWLESSLVSLDDYFHYYNWIRESYMGALKVGILFGIIQTILAVVLWSKSGRSNVS